MKTLTTTIPPRTLIALLTNIDDQGLPWEFIGDLRDPNVLTLSVDGSETKASIHLNP